MTPASEISHNRLRRDRNGFFDRARVILAPVLAALAVSHAQEFPSGPPPTSSGIVLRASFDHGPTADLGAGYLAMARTDRTKADPAWQLVFSPGKFGQALDLRPESQKEYRGQASPGAFAIVKAQGHVCLPTGSISFWVRSTRRPFSVGVTTQSNDQQVPLPVFNLTGGNGTLVVQRTTREQARLDSRIDDVSICDGAWHHIALVWAVDAGLALYIDGGRREGARLAVPWQVGYMSVGSLLLSGGEFDELRIYDCRLEERAVQALAGGNDELPQREFSRQPIREAHRLQALGWQEPEGNRFIGLRGPTRIRLVDLADARAVRTSGWRAVDGVQDSGWPLRYHGYESVVRGPLHLKIAGAQPRFNVVRVVGDFHEADLAEGNSPIPADSRQLLSLTGGGFLRQYSLSPPSTAQAVSVYLRREQNTYRGTQHGLHDLALLDVGPETAGALRPHTSGHVVAQEPARIAGGNRVRLVNWYAPGERRIGTAAATGPGQSSIEIAALEFFHLMLPAQERDLPLDSVTVRLDVPEWTAGNTLNLRLHDPFNLGRALIDVDVRQETTGRLEVTLQFPATILPANTELWLTLASRQGGRLRGTSTLSASGPAMDVAQRSYLAWQHRLLKDTLAVISEARPWGSNDFSRDPQHRVALTQYDAIARLTSDLHRRFPDDRWTRGYMLFTHPAETSYWKSLPITLPRDDQTPRWAMLQKELLGQFHHFVNWWIDQRQIPSGELGNHWRDDTDLVGDWVSLALISDPEGKFKRSQRLVADYTWRHLNADGLNIQEKGTLHAYEDGINANALAALLHYGNPVIWERMLATARRYDGFLLTPEKDGKRRLATNWYSTTAAHVRPEDNWQFGYHILHPGMNLVWYNGNPALVRMLAELFAGMPPKSDTLPGLPHLLFAQTRDNRYVDHYGDPSMNAVWARLLNRETCEPARLNTLVTFDVDVSRTNILGNQNDTALRKYLAWRYTRDKAHLVPALEALYKQTYYTMPLYTETEQSGDRVAVHKLLTDFMYTGGLPGARGQSFPFFALSYDGFSRHFAGLVLQDTSTALRWVGYNFEERPQDGRLRVWNLAPGTYKIRIGPDDDGDDRIDGAAHTFELDLKRYETIPVSLPVRRSIIVEAMCVRQDVPLHDRCDLAITHEDAEREGDRLAIKVHSLGSKPTGPFTVAVFDAAGRRHASQEHIGLPGIDDLREKAAAMTFQDLPTEGNLSVRVTGPRKEITESNNVAVVGVPMNSRGSGRAGQTR